MKCEKIRKWLSDKIDGELPEGKEKKVEEHLHKCSECRAYWNTIERIHQLAIGLPQEEASPEYWEELPAKVKHKLSSLKSSVLKRKTRFFIWKWNWAWITVGVILVIFTGFFLFTFRTQPVQEEYVFSFEETLEKVYQEIGENKEFENIFNLVILASIGEALGEPEEEIIPENNDLYSFLEEITKEELNVLDSEMKKEINS